MEEGLKIAKGQNVNGSVITEFIVNEPKSFSAKSIKKLRQKLNVSQSIFAQIIGISVNALRNWEQERNKPSTIACRFLEIIENDPKLFLKQAENMKIIKQNQKRA